MQALTLEQRIELTRGVMAILDHWAVPAAAQIRLLALPDATKPRSLHRYHQDTPLPDEPEIMERIEHLIGIADALRTSYPRNASMDAQWLNTVNARFDNRTPLEVMVEDGLDGVVAVRVLLDCAYDWHISGSGR
jgi:hypothetical protein